MEKCFKQATFETIKKNTPFFRLPPEVKPPEYRIKCREGRDK